LDILQMCGYSAETFGIYEGGGNTKTATEIEAKQQRSLLTRDRKTRLWIPALGAVLTKLLAVDRDILHNSVIPDGLDIDVVFADAVQESQLSIAQTVQLLRAADAASDEVIVGMVHPDWDQDKILEEVALITAAREAAKPAALPDPMFMHPSDGNSDGGTPADTSGGTPVNG
jgi:hypothetical protein